MPKDDIQVLARDDDRFPSSLRRLADCPDRIYCRGDAALLSPAYIRFAVVGTRAMTSYGSSVVKVLVPRLATPATVVVSGLALGVDAAAHEASLQAGIPTIAVLGGGIDRASVYPRQNVGLSDRIVADGGLIVGEEPPGTPSLAHVFPKRNRIIAALSKAVIVIEAAARSGTSITAKMALDAGRDVFAVPGNLFQPMSVGTNTLIAAGAIPVCAPDDILAYYGLTPAPDGRMKLDLTPVQTSLLDAIRDGVVTPDDLCVRTGESAQKIMAELTTLELAGAVIRSGEQYIRVDSLSRE